MIDIAGTAGSCTLLLLPDSVVDLTEIAATYAGCGRMFCAFVSVQIARRHEYLKIREAAKKMAWYPTCFGNN